MNIPKPPPDIELKNIIDKLATFVARNGLEFEEMTKNKQKGNPRFDFLFGGEHHNYYRYKISSEQTGIREKNKAMQNSNSPPITNNGPNIPSPWINSSNRPPHNDVNLETLTNQQHLLNEHIRESESNLSAQHKALQHQQEIAIIEAVSKAEDNDIEKAATECGINFKEFDETLEIIIDQCTKDSISTGKSWIIQRATAPIPNSVIMRYLLKKVMDRTASFSRRLHIIYLLNDTLHHCMRKHVVELKKSIEEVMVPMFCIASVNSTDEQRAKLQKLLNLWETKSHYFSKEVIHKLKNPTVSLTEHKDGMVKKYAAVVDEAIAASKKTYQHYESQHQAFVAHILQQIQNIEKQKFSLEQQKQVAASITERENISHAPPPPTNQFHQQHQQSINHFQQGPYTNDTVFNADGLPPFNHSVPNLHEPNSTNMDHVPPLPPPSQVPFNQPPPGFAQPPPSFPPDISLPDVSRPPPNFATGIPPLMSLPPPEFIPEDLMPTLPYYELPAGLMVPLVSLEDCNYKPLNPEDMRLPPPAPPSERLLAAVKAFYIPPGHDRPRDSDGWEKLGLYEYYRAKTMAKQKKMDEISEGIKCKSRSPTPIRRSKSHSRTPPTTKKRFRSRSRSKSKGKESRSKSRSRSRSPPRNRSNRRSPPRSKRRERSRSRSVSPFLDSQRSPTPPSFLGSSYGKMVDKIDETNKGHQMLRKMGWGGAGLGANEQGIEAPIDGGEVRDRTDQYKGVGINLSDPYESFRKSKGQAFITRMKERAEERLSGS